ncbi:REP-associated tyrosine transposase [Terriglobus sp. ADX1]|uniref:REP-associated tyrosine transposase n=1 Tax=Terriglobus sp. ADX1 TaxID=2794063 RepID=UPI002FE555EB
MPTGLVRYQQSGHLHAVNFSCDQRRPYLGTPAAKDLFEDALERMRLRYGFFVKAYVVMPEHVHLVISETDHKKLSTAIQALKLSVVRRRSEKPFWLSRYYDFNIFQENKLLEKIDYLHRNPIARGLVLEPQDWKWSSYRHWQTGEEGPVQIESPWTARKRGGLLS